MKGHIKIFIVAAISILAACQNNSKTGTISTDTTKTTVVKTDTMVIATGTAKWANVEIKIPQGWTNQVKTMNGRKLLFLLGPIEAGYQTNMNVLKDPMKGENLDDYIKVSLAKMQNMKVQMGPSGDMPVNGIKGRYLKYVYNAPERIIVVKSYVFAHNDTAYVLTATTIPELGKKYEPIFDQAVNSLKIK